jgi:hypothetical protein
MQAYGIKFRSAVPTTRFTRTVQCRFTASVPVHDNDYTGYLQFFKAYIQYFIRAGKRLQENIDNKI